MLVTGLNRVASLWRGLSGVSATSLAPLVGDAKSLIHVDQVRAQTPQVKSHPVRSLQSALASRLPLGVTALTIPLLSGCDASTLNPLMVTQLVVGAGFVIGSATLVRSALTVEPKQIAAAQNNIQSLEAFLERAANHSERGAFLETYEGVLASIDILEKMRGEVVDAVASGAKKILELRDTVASCDKLLAELNDLPAENKGVFKHKLLTIKQSAADKITELTEDHMARIRDKAALIPRWIESQKTREQDLQTQATLQDRARRWNDKASKLFGKGEQLILATSAVQSGMTNLIAELDALGDDLEYARALQELDAVALLAESKGLDEDLLTEIREMTSERTRTRALAGGVK